MENRLLPRYAFQLEDLRVWHLVRVSCDACSHKAAIGHAVLLRGRPGYMRLSELERRLKVPELRGEGYSFA
jgi:hypothetical protein